MGFKNSLTPETPPHAHAPSLRETQRVRGITFRVEPGSATSKRTSVTGSIAFGAVMDTMADKTKDAATGAGRGDYSVFAAMICVESVHLIAPQSSLCLKCF